MLLLICGKVGCWLQWVGNSGGGHGCLCHRFGLGFRTVNTPALSSFIFGQLK